MHTVFETIKRLSISIVSYLFAFVYKDKQLVIGNAIGTVLVYLVILEILPLLTYLLTALLLFGAFHLWDEANGPD